MIPGQPDVYTGQATAPAYPTRDSSVIEPGVDASRTVMLIVKLDVPRDPLIPALDLEQRREWLSTISAHNL